MSMRMLSAVVYFCIFHLNCFSAPALKEEFINEEWRLKVDENNPYFQSRTFQEVLLQSKKFCPLIHLAAETVRTQNYYQFSLNLSAWLHYGVNNLVNSVIYSLFAPFLVDGTVAPFLLEALGRNASVPCRFKYFSAAPFLHDLGAMLMVVTMENGINPKHLIQCLGPFTGRLVPWPPGTGNEPFLHGAVRHIVAVSRLEDVWDVVMFKLYDHTDPADGAFMYNILHAAGHGALYRFLPYTGYNTASSATFANMSITADTVLSALGVCQKAPLQELRVVCSEGVFMSYFTYAPNTTLFICSRTSFQVPCFHRGIHMSSTRSWFSFNTSNIASSFSECLSFARDKQGEAGCVVGVSALLQQSHNIHDVCGWVINAPHILSLKISEKLISCVTGYGNAYTALGTLHHWHPQVSQIEKECAYIQHLSGNVTQTLLNQAMRICVKKALTFSSLYLWPTFEYYGDIFNEALLFD